MSDPIKQGGPWDIVGTKAGETISGTDHDDALFGLGGDDTIIGGFGHDRLAGGDGNDALSGGTDQDVLWGGKGADTLSGGADDDYLFGDSDGADDTYDGGVGVNTLDFSHAAKGITVELKHAGEGKINDGAGGKDAFYGIDVFRTTKHDDSFSGSDGEETAFLGGGNDVAHGHGGVDSLSGGGGNDKLFGGSGDDEMAGGAGSDELFGGKGNDVFIFDAKLNEKTNVDAIGDFSSAAGNHDMLWLDVSKFHGLAEGALAADAFHLGTHAADKEDRIVYDQKHGDLYFDQDGSGSKYEAVKFAHFDNHASLSWQDFFVAEAATVLAPI